MEKVYFRKPKSRDELVLSLQHVIRLEPTTGRMEGSGSMERMLRPVCSCGWKSDSGRIDPRFEVDMDDSSWEGWWDMMELMCDEHSSTHLLLYPWGIDAHVDEVQMDLSEDDEVFLRQAVKAAGVNTEFEA